MHRPKSAILTLLTSILPPLAVGDSPSYIHQVEQVDKETVGEVVLSKMVVRGEIVDCSTSARHK